MRGAKVVICEPGPTNYREAIDRVAQTSLREMIGSSMLAALDAQAVRIKHISSPVVGLADVLIVPNIEAGNMVYRNLALMADAQIAGLVVGAPVPVFLTSRADTAAARRFSAAAVLYADALTRDPTILLLPEIAE